MSTGSNSVVVKQERDDEAEIREMAAKMVEQQRAKQATTATQSISGTRSSSLVAPNQPSIMGFFKNSKGTDENSVDSVKSVGDKPPIDEFSQKGEISLGTYLKYIFVWEWEEIARYWAEAPSLKQAKLS